MKERILKTIEEIQSFINLRKSKSKITDWLEMLIRYITKDLKSLEKNICCDQNKNRIIGGYIEGGVIVYSLAPNVNCPCCGFYMLRDSVVLEKNVVITPEEQKAINEILDTEDVKGDE